MLKNYLKVALRHYQKHKSYATLNLLGLAVGYAAFGLILVYVHYESSFENFHTQSERIFRPTYEYANKDFHVHWARVPVDFINQLPADIPEIETLIRFQNQERKYIRVGEDKFRPDHAYTTDAEVFQVFGFQLVNGDPATALASPNSVVISRDVAQKYFGTEDAIGKEIFVIGDFSPEEKTYKVTGIMENVPSNTHLPAEIFFSFGSPEERTGWAYVYVVLNPGTDIASVKEKMPDFISNYLSENQGDNLHIDFQALSSIHLTSQLAREIQPNGDKTYVQIFFFVGLFILAIAIINFVNLSTAMSMSRSKEIGMRKILGAEKSDLVKFALLESMLYNLAAAGLSLLIVIGTLPFFQELMGISMILPMKELIGVLLVVATICGILAGIYPAFILTGFHSLEMVKHQHAPLGKRSAFPVKRIMVGLQFCAAILLIGSASIAYMQVRFLNEKNLGISQDQIISIPGVPSKVKEGYKEFRDRLNTISGVENVAACMETPSREIRDSGPVLVQGLNDDVQQAPMMDMQVISPGYVDLMGIELLAGEDRSDEMPFDFSPELTENVPANEYLGGQKRAYLINETAMRGLGWETPEEAIGQQINWSISNFQLAYGPITGVVKDYHQETLKNKVDPTIMVVEPIWLGTFLIKVNTANVVETIASIQGVWDDMFPSYPMEYHFVDEMYNQLYKQERVQLQLLLLLSGLAIFLAFMGLFSLVAYALKTREKELAIRRVMGAVMSDLVQLISKEYWIILIISSLIAIPVSYVIVNDWLANFAYRITITPLSYVLTLVFVGGLLFATVGLQTFRNSRENPADTLRDE